MDKACTHHTPITRPCLLVSCAGRMECVKLYEGLRRTLADRGRAVRDRHLHQGKSAEDHMDDME